VELDRWDIVPGDMIPHFMERIQRSDFVLIVCTPKYKDRSDNRRGGVGYEGNIMTAELYADGNRRKFIPILRTGPWREAAPIWLLGARYLDFQDAVYDETAYTELLDTVFGIRRPRPGPATLISRQRTGPDRLDIMSLTPEDEEDPS